MKSAEPVTIYVRKGRDGVSRTLAFKILPCRMDATAFVVRDGFAADGNVLVGEVRRDADETVWRGPCGTSGNTMATTLHRAERALVARLTDAGFTPRFDV